MRESFARRALIMRDGLVGEVVGQVVVVAAVSVAGSTGELSRDQPVGVEEAVAALERAVVAVEAALERPGVLRAPHRS